MSRLPLAAAAAVVVAAGAWIAVTAAAPAPRTRTYYVAADEVEWDYAPAGRDLLTGQPWDSVSGAFMEAGPRRMGRKVLKALYREYTDSTFRTVAPRPPQWEYLGFLGPLIRAEVGDTLRIVFRNHTRFPVSVHPHGVFYLKDSEGAPYEDGTAGDRKGDDGVPPQGGQVYVWPVPERAGPTAHETSTAFWMYHSHTREVEDVNAGLIGPMIIGRRGALRADGTPKDVDREVVIGFIEVDEGASLYTDHNVRTYWGAPDSVIRAIVFGTPSLGPDGPVHFRETMNGFMYGNLPMPRMRVGERVRWYIMGSTNFEIHSPHWHGNVVELDRMRTDVAQLLAMGMAVADMTPDNPGVWLFHCHVGPHLLMGMQGRYEVVPRDVALR
jgi:FtsP/CotA-like multicopper oxidase with cupredoxin domain